jgi:hypothetical protein
VYVHGCKTVKGGVWSVFLIKKKSCGCDLPFKNSLPCLLCDHFFEHIFLFQPTEREVTKKVSGITFEICK